MTHKSTKNHDVCILNNNFKSNVQDNIFYLFQYEIEVSYITNIMIRVQT